MSKKNLRCVICTRKSTEEGLDQDFNSLDAQREACAAYIKSQASEGWKLIDKQFSDGGISGGTMERPALQELLEEIKQGRVDVVVVYKIDRLTRSLMDFARMVEVFDKHEVSFVSITQQFNTTTSMGRLTLNVLLSFAQFEREVTAERIRDKIAASKRKGMWMGGPVPVGYSTADKKLVVEPNEARTVRQLFCMYLELGSVFELKERLDDLGWRTPVRISRNGNRSGDKPYSRGQLYWILRNPIYIGNVRHGDQVWPGQHEAIIDDALWQTVQEQLLRGSNAGVHTKEPARQQLLTGILFDETGDRLTPSHAGGKTRRYRYYVSQRLLHGSRKDQSGWRLPAPQLEKTVNDGISEFLTDQPKLTDAIGGKDREADEISSAIHAAKAKSDELKRGGKITRDAIHEIVSRIEIFPERLAISMSSQRLASTLGISPDQNASLYSLEIPVAFRKRGIETKMLVGTQSSGPADQNLISTIAQAHAWLNRLNGENITISQLANDAEVDDGEISRILPLAFLAPDVVRSIVEGRHPPELTTRRLKRLKPLPPLWDDQRKALNFPAQN